MKIKEINKILNLNYKSIKDLKNNVDWVYISKFQNLSEPFIEKFQNKVDWDYISIYQKLSEPFIEKFEKLVNWDFISQFQKLSEPFIEKFQNKVDWNVISKFQKLSEPFIEKFQNKVDWDYISKFQKLSEPFIEKFEKNLTIDKKNNMLYFSKSKKLELIKKSKLYEIENDFIFAYKGIRSDNYSNFNFQYFYEIGKTYESHCDCNLDNENSFGLSAWTLEKAKEYCNQKIIKVKIHIDDLGAIVQNENKLRCFKFEILEEIKN